MSKNSKILIAGGGYADIPLIVAAKKLGFYVITSGNRPDELGHSYADEYRKSDFSDPQAMLAIAQDLNISAICPCCNDFSALSCAYVAEKLNLPGHDSFETAKIIHHKDLYRKFARENNIPTPRAISAATRKQAFDSIEVLGFPVIIKPVDLTGGKGVSTIYEKNEISHAIEKAFHISRAKRIVVEEFIAGSRHGFSVFLRDGRVVFSFSDNEYYYLNPYLVAGAFTPGIVPESALIELREVSEKIAALLSLKTGIFHIQYLFHKGRPVIVEICRRPPGDLYVKLVEHATGIDYSSWIVRAFAGMDCHELTHNEPYGFFARHCVMASSSGRLKDIKFSPSINPMIFDKLMWWRPGDKINDALTTKFGIVFFKFKSQTEMVSITEHLHELIVPHIE